MSWYFPVREAATVQETLAFCGCLRGFRDKRRATRRTARKIGPFAFSPATSHKKPRNFWDMYHEKNDDMKMMVLKPGQFKIQQYYSMQQLQSLLSVEFHYNKKSI
uniref:Uncharacterized protein n=1 Tax=Wuchereria bancrofti TaxID=6293 RepID=A0A1I8F0M2_WUCBA